MTDKHPDIENLKNLLTHDNLDIELPWEDKRLGHLLKVVVSEVKQYADDQSAHIKKLAQIGLALSMEKDIGRLLELIVDEARSLSGADAGTLYIMDKDHQNLHFEIMQNSSLNIRMKGTGKIGLSLPDVPLYIENGPNYANVCSYVALIGETINIPDAYRADGFDFSGTREYDAATGYRCRSMLVIPMKNHENRIIGVLQLFNAKDPETADIVSFSEAHADLIAALASQAAVALTNTQLIEDLSGLFYAFIKSIATAIDEKSPHTGGHINRVVALTMMIADAINAADTGPFKDIYFDESALEELRMAAWMHDVGKITTPEYLLDKSTRLNGISDGFELIRTRFALIRETLEKKLLTQKLALPHTPCENDCEQCRTLDEQHHQDLARLEDDLDFIKCCNHPAETMDDAKIARLNSISQKTYAMDRKRYPYLTETEVAKLSIPKGTLDASERAAIENHAQMTYRILSQLPFPARLKNVPLYSAAHHERPDGKGYPNGLSGDALPLQARVLAIADVFEALTARDRPYKDPIKISGVLEIMAQMKDRHHIDADIYDLFVKNQIFEKYRHHLAAQKSM